jgi:hypothetical protein
MFAKNWLNAAGTNSAVRRLRATRIVLVLVAAAGRMYEV